VVTLKGELEGNVLQGGLVVDARAGEVLMVSPYL